MSGIVTWIREHRWETVSAVLGLGLIVAIVFIVLDGDEAPELPAESTATTLAPSTTTADETVTTEEFADAATTTTLGGTPEGVTAVVVDNVPDAGLPIGLNEAELLIETPVEGGLSRFTAFYGEEIPGIVGPVRSLRPVSADLLAPFNPVVFTTGGQPFVLGAVEGAGATIVTPEDSIAFQSLERPQPYHVFVSPETEAHEGADLVAPWEVGEWQGGEPAAEVTLPIAGGVTWRFENGMYVRYRNGAVQEVLSEVDGEPQPITRETLVVLVANEKSAGYTDGNGVDVPTFDVIGGGDVYVYHDGEMISGGWFRASQAEGYVLSTTDGDPLSVPSAGTYLAITPSGASGG